MVDMAKAFSYTKNFLTKPDQNMAWNQTSIQHFRGMHTLAREAMQSNLSASLVNRRLLSKERPSFYLELTSFRSSCVHKKADTKSQSPPTC